MQSKSDGNMEDVVTEKVCSTPPVLETQESPDVKTNESAENFQKFMYELFEKNGVMNDLRAYLRGHIVGILRSARTGDPPPCQKHFTQRLELPYQALNMLIAEYLLGLEFSYTLSVFISEIPLANMVLHFARSLMQGNHTNTALRFQDEDVWSILNYLGAKCDSDHASNIVEMYREETQTPLLLCMLKCLPFYTPTDLDKVSSLESVSSSVKSSDRVTACSRSHRTQSRCKHLIFCKTCHGNMLRIREKYRKKKKTLAKNIKESSVKSQNVESLIKNLDVIERNLINEMFQQLKSVCEAEMQIAKTEEETRVKRSLATHAVQLKRKRDEMEENFKARELELTRSVQHKKRFLWGLAQLLREQHQHMARAMLDVQAETGRLSAKEDSLKCQLAEAEASLRSRGEDMRRQISNELALLEAHLDSMKRERDNINRERSELEHMKLLCDSNEKTMNMETKEDLRTHYELLKNEFNILKKYLENAKLEAKCVVERSTLTDDSIRNDGVLNNGQDLDRSRSEDRVKAKQVVNDLKKMKNVNFVQSNLAEIYRERSRSSPSRSTGSSEGGDTTRPDTMRHDTTSHVTRLMEENERLRTFSRQQREHIDELSSHQARLQAELTAARLPLAPSAPRPRTAPATLPNSGLLQRMSPSGNASRLPGHGWRKGAGEEMSLLATLQPRILVPGDPVPFIGVARDRHNEHRRYLINQWRSLRRRASPGAVGRRPASASSPRGPTGGPATHYNSAGPSVHLPSEEELNYNENEGVTDHSYKRARDQNEQRSKNSEKSTKSREKHDKFVLKESKERLKSNDKDSERSPSPGAVIRDAKLRLRKLEIEAEAVEKSYLDFRRKQDVMRTEKHQTHDDDGTKQKYTDLKHDRPSFKDVSRLESTSRRISQEPIFEQIIENIDEYHAKYDIGVKHFKNQNTTPMKVRPIPTSSFEAPIKTKRNQNYLETSMAEFRKYYHSEKRAANEDFEDRPRTMNRDLQRNEGSPRTTFPRQADEDRSSTRNHKVIYESNDLPKTVTHDEESINENEHKSPKDNKSPSNTDANNTTSPKTKRNITKGDRTDVFQRKHDQAKELEILKQNISKIYNVPEKAVAESIENYIDGKRTNEKTGIIEETITEASIDEVNSDRADKNLLRIEVQSVSQVNDVKTDSHTQDLLLVVESSKIAEHSDMDIISTQMTILVSPKRSNSEKSVEMDAKSFVDSPGEKSVKRNRDVFLNSIYQSDANENMSSVQMQLDNSKDVLVPFLSDIDINEDADYPDDFSADIENLNSFRYDTDQDRSPISVVKTSDDENFWES